MTQRYISRELTHFVGRAENSQDSQSELLIEIVKSGALKSRFDWEGILISKTDVNKNISGNEMFISRMVCFCDIPFGDLNVHMKKYSAFGLAFPKKFAVSQGASPMMYIAQNSAAGLLNGLPVDRGQVFDVGKLFLTASSPRRIPEGLKMLCS